jgi:hypothetical protein
MIAFRRGFSRTLRSGTLAFRNRTLGGARTSCRRFGPFQAFGCGTQTFPNAGLEGWRHVKMTDRHAGVDYAQMLKELPDMHFPKSNKIVLVQGNLSTHKPASLYEAFLAEEARRLVERFEWHYTPKHGSWLDMAECQLSVLSS